MIPNSYRLAERGKRLSCIAVMSTRGMEDVNMSYSTAGTTK